MVYRICVQTNYVYNYFLRKLQIWLEKISLRTSTTINRVKVRDRNTMPPVSDTSSGCLGNTFALDHTSLLCHFHTKARSTRHCSLRRNFNIVFGNEKNGFLHSRITHCFPEIFWNNSLYRWHSISPPEAPLPVFAYAG